MPTGDDTYHRFFVKPTMQIIFCHENIQYFGKKISMRKICRLCIAISGLFLPTGLIAQVVVDPVLEQALSSNVSASMLFPILSPAKLEVIVSFDGTGGVTAPEIQMLKDLGITKGVAFSSFPVVAVLASPGQINMLKSTPGVRSVFANKQLTYFNERSTELTDVDRIRSDSSMIAANGGLPVTGAGVAVLINDSGVDGKHADVRYSDHLVQNVLGTLNVASSAGILPPVYMENIPSTDANSGHGTHCAGIIGGSGKRSAGRFEGVAPGAHLVGYGSGVLISIVDALGGFDYALINRQRYGIRVVNNSWGSTGVFDPADPINIATKTLYDHGMVVVFAAGNEGPSANTMNPYSLAPWVISAGAGDVNRQLADFSSRGLEGDELTFTTNGETWVLQNRPSLTAPGVSIISTRALSPLPVLSTVADLDELSPAELPYYTHMSGTSMAAPHVAGIIALMLEANPSLSPASVNDILQSTSTPMPGHEAWEAGAGYVNAFEAVTRAFEMRTAEASQTDATLIAPTHQGDIPSDQHELRTHIVAVYPNPFVADVTIAYSLKDDGPVTITLFDRFGQQVANVLNAVERKGSHVVHFQKSDFSLGPGLYVARIKTADHSQTVTLMVPN